MLVSCMHVAELHSTVCSSAAVSRHDRVYRAWAGGAASVPQRLGMLVLARPFLRALITAGFCLVVQGDDTVEECPTSCWKGERTEHKASFPTQSACHARHAQHMVIFTFDVPGARVFTRASKHAHVHGFPDEFLLLS
eukprot:77581-Pleurochrysis_carterae.AAC.5